MSVKILEKTILVLGLVAMVGCSDLTTQEQRMLTGAAAGTTVGAVGTVLFGGCVACGAAIGGAVGTATGYAVDQYKSSRSSSY